MTPERLRQIEDLFHAARERTLAERGPFLAGACSGDSALRHDVQRLLDQQPAGVFDAPVAALVAGLVIAPEARLEPGSAVGPYRIERLLGAGGMGEVYRARDTTLGRDVAIKILPRAFTSDPERLARFEREARMLAALNHPHIGAIYGIEESDGVRALVLELAEGETLADRLQRGPVAATEALTIARQIADALDAAHEKGIIHRDLKPANVKITADGVVKVLDFGLAKAVASDETVRDLPHAPGLTVGGTRKGIIIGTAAYMSPEQARGLTVDKRTDIWAFGCLLFEMLTGRAAFAGETVTDTLAAILDREPDWMGLPATAPPAAGRLLRLCLDKDPRHRLRDIGDARVELEWPAAEPQRPSRPAYRAVALMLTLLILAAAIGLFYAARRSGAVTSPAEYTPITNFTDSAVAPSLSPDGRMVTFIRSGGSAAHRLPDEGEPFVNRGQIYVKLLPNGESVQLTNDSTSKSAPVFTPDGSRIAYTRTTPGHWDTWTVPVLGGPPARFLPNASGLTWITDHRVLFSEIPNGIGAHMGIVTATDARADSRQIYLPANEHAMAHYSYASPDGRSVLLVEMTGAHRFDQPCRLIPFDGSSHGRQIGPQGACTSAAWSPDGRWMYFGAGVGGGTHLWRQSFPNGAPEQITFGPLEEEGIAVAPDGRSLVTSIGTRRSAIWIHDATGERAISSEGYATLPRLSRDGTRVFYLLARDGWQTATWVPSSAELRSVDLASGKSDSVLLGVSVSGYDISRDEKEVAFTTTESNGESLIWLASLDRSAPPHQVARGDQVSFGADGHLVFRSVEEQTNVLVRIKSDGSGRERITAVPIVHKYGVSPDGEWVVVHSTGTGVNMGNPTLVIPIRGGAPSRVCPSLCLAAWSPDGKFFYVKFDRESVTSPGKTLVIRVVAGQSLPDLPVSGIDGAAGGVTLPGARVIEYGSLSTGPDPSTFVFTKADVQRNLYRIPLH
jgi:Tol biopolymer transport system component